ncbi:MAG TPA: 50S ribosomal protein L18 [Bacteroidales bacterium]|nr:50S ribosomal protein L18 [Bacteroidales bacterium]
MSFKNTKLKRRLGIKKRIRKIVSGSPERPRLSVFRSNKEIYAQLIDDKAGRTLLAVSSRDKGLDETKVNKTEQAKITGKRLAEKAIAAGIEACVFDRNGYLYHGRVKALAEAAREGGLKF